MRSASLLGAISILVVLAGCDRSKPGAAAGAPGETSAASTANPANAPGSSNVGGALRLGAPIEANAQKVALADVAKSPDTYVGKTFATTGTVTAVCQHMGCWMEIKDDASEAHIKMAGHAFFVPKTASGKKARVLAKLVKGDTHGACEDEDDDKVAAAGAKGAGEHHEHKGKGCRAEAEAQLGRPLAKLELVAEGVELM